MHQNLTTEKLSRTVSKNNSNFQVVNDKLFWDNFENGNWEPFTFSVIDRFLNNRKGVVLDIGGLNGVISLYVASKGNTVYCFEPDPVAQKALAANLAVNPELKERIIFINKALTSDGNDITLYSRWAFGDSGSSILPRVKSKNAAVTVKSITIDDFEKQYSGGNKIAFMKMDIEGAEFFVVPSMISFLEKHKPVFYLSLHCTSLLEYYEKKLIPYGFARRIYRALDSNKNYLKKKVVADYKKIFNELNFYTHCFYHDLEPFDRNNISYEKIENLDSVVLSMHKPV